MPGTETNTRASGLVPHGFALAGDSCFQRSRGEAKTYLSLKHTTTHNYIMETTRSPYATDIPRQISSADNSAVDDESSFVSSNPSDDDSYSLLLQQAEEQTEIVTSCTRIGPSANTLRDGRCYRSVCALRVCGNCTCGNCTSTTHVYTTVIKTCTQPRYHRQTDGGWPVGS